MVLVKSFFDIEDKFFPMFLENEIMQWKENLAHQVKKHLTLKIFNGFLQERILVHFKSQRVDPSHRISTSTLTDVAADLEAFQLNQDTCKMNK